MNPSREEAQFVLVLEKPAKDDRKAVIDFRRTLTTHVNRDPNEESHEKSGKSSPGISRERDFHSGITTVMP